MSTLSRWTLLVALGFAGLQAESPQQRPRAYWKTIVDSGYELPEGESAFGLIVELSSHLGSTDSELRDDFGYGIPAAWIVGQKLLDREELLGLIELWSANLGHEIGRSGDDSVLLRSFSALNLALIASHDNDRPFLEREDFDELLRAALDYLDRERDLRGWTEKAGWYHSAAHTADLLKFLGRSRHLTPQGQGAILGGIAERLWKTEGYVFVHGEDERLAAAILSLLARDDLEPRLVETFAEELEGARRRGSPAGFDPVHFAGQQNAKALLRVLFVALSRERGLPPHLVALRERLLAALGGM